MWEFLGFESERGGSVCWPNNKIIDTQGSLAKKKVILRKHCPLAIGGEASYYLGHGFK